MDLLGSRFYTGIIVGSGIYNAIFLRLLFDLAMKIYFVELSAEFHQFEPFRIVSSVFSCETSRLRFSAAVAVLHSVHSSVTTMRTPLLLAIMIQYNSGSQQLD